MNDTITQAYAILDAHKAETNVEYMQVVANDENVYAERGYDGKVVCLGNFNDNEVGDKLEEIGVGCEWDDEWIVCDDCGRIYRCSPDSYGWLKYGWENEDGAQCGECVNEDASHYLEWLEGDHDKASTIVDDLGEHGYIKIDVGFEHGLHGGQCANPELIANLLRGADCERFVFEITSTGQFDSDFVVWVHEDDYNESMADTLTEGKTDGVDPAEVMKAQLRGV